MQPTVWSVINKVANTYARCEAKGCDTYGARIALSGMFTNIEIPGRNVLARLAEFDVYEIKKFSFSEVVTQFHAVYVSYGSCKPADSH